MARTIPQAWQGYRTRNRVATALLLAGLPAAFAVVVAVKIAFGGTGEFMLIASITLWCVAWGWAAVRVARWPCPRCNVPWLSNQEVQFAATRKCANCGLSLYEEP